MKRAKEHYDKHLEGVKKNDSKPERKEQIRLTSQRKRDSGRYREWQRSMKGKESAKKSRKNREDKKHNISKSDLKELYEYCDAKCMYCGFSESDHLDEYNKRLFKDHVLIGVLMELTTVFSVVFPVVRQRETGIGMNGTFQAI
ncbi:hypothetical protein [Paenibacillus lautus]|uniref:hypothetical protein n=1 Tax=Paenibacillus lautus TaxID=1401 RepID=UPI001C7D80D6|nr:hypothetical protein [Paenibacillus lautus]MBX4152355.1 hypothetical protein [Paenibacillus lautus]